MSARNEFSAPNPLARAVWEACYVELEAMKPGNVSLHSPGHGMDAQEFLKSARAIAGILAEPGLSVGTRVLRSVEATRQAVGCNTNLGIVLLCAPLAQAFLEAGAGDTLRGALASVLRRLDKSDAEQVFAAIRLADPGGLGDSPRHDVKEPAGAPLLEVMREAEGRDRIAYQYTHDFVDVLEVGLPALKRGLARWRSEPWAAVAVYLQFLARFPDTHIRRKLGRKIAEEVQHRAGELLSRLELSAEPDHIVQQLSAFDLSLKEQAINPGTSADLTVATLLARRVERMLDRKRLERARGEPQCGAEDGHSDRQEIARTGLTSQ